MNNNNINLNNFDFLRLVFSLVVFFIHLATLTNKPELFFVFLYLNSGIAVKCFFIISGFLIFRSYDNSKSIKDYFIKRVKRLYPAYIVVILVSAIGGVLLTELSFKGYFTSFIFWKYILSNLLFCNFLQPDLPNVFQNNVFHAVNGALWTLKIEVGFYIIVPIVSYLFCLLGRKVTLVSLYLISILYFLVLNLMASKTEINIYYELSKQLPGQLSYFLSGAIFYYYFHSFNKYSNKILLMIMGIIIYFFTKEYPSLYFLEPISLSLIVMSFAFGSSFFRNFGKYGDLSYGIYIFHFPIIQILINYHFFDKSPLYSLLLTTLILLVIALLSWHLIEKRFLRRAVA